MTEFEILSALADAGGSMSFIDLLNYSRSMEGHDPSATKQMLRAMLTAELISGSTDAYGRLSIEPAGRYHLDTLLRHQAEFSASQEKIGSLTSELSATRAALDETTQKLAVAESALAENNARLSAAEAHAEKSDKKARLYFWGGIVATIVCTFLGWLLGKHF